MIPELGHYALILAFCVSLVQGILPTLSNKDAFAPTLAEAEVFPVGWFAEKLIKE